MAKPYHMVGGKAQPGRVPKRAIPGSSRAGDRVDAVPRVSRASLKGKKGVIKKGNRLVQTVRGVEVGYARLPSRGAGGGTGRGGGGA